jgi:SAM-dependent methyltransferase
MDYDVYVAAEVYDKARALLPATARLWQELLADYIDPGATQLILDLGCGTGRFSELLAQRSGGRILGIDPSERMLQQARRKPSPGNISRWESFGRSAAAIGRLRRPRLHVVRQPGRRRAGMPLGAARGRVRLHS